MKKVLLISLILPIFTSGQNSKNIVDFVNEKVFECWSFQKDNTDWYYYLKFDKSSKSVNRLVAPKKELFELNWEYSDRLNFTTHYDRYKGNFLKLGACKECISFELYNNMLLLKKGDVSKVCNILNVSFAEDLSSIIKKQVEQRVNIWQKKDEFEKLADYRQRVNETTRKKVIQKFQKEVIEKLAKQYKSSLNLSDIKIGEYDSENETFLFKWSQVGNFIIKVPIQKAKSFKEAFNNRDEGVFFNPQFIFLNNKFKLSHIECNLNRNVSRNIKEKISYEYNIDNQSAYSQTKIDYNFSDIEIDLPKTQGSTNRVTKINKISVGKSDVDMDIPVNNKRNPHRYALIIGNEDYSSFQTDLSSEVNVDYAINDAKVFSEYCEKTLGVDSRHLKLYTNATYGQMSQAISWVQNLSKIEGGNAEIIFYYSGHGLPDEVTKEGYLMPVDISGNNVSKGISLKYLYQELNKYPAKEITVVLDACFSGGARNEGLIAMKGVKINTKEEVFLGNMVVFASSSGSESSAVYREKQHGYLTYFLLKKIQETKGYVNYKDLSDYLDYQVRKETALIGKVQTPKVNVSPSAKDQWKYWSFR